MPKATGPHFAVDHKKLSDLTPDKRNANRGTDRGAKAIIVTRWENATGKKAAKHGAA